MADSRQGIGATLLRDRSDILVALGVIVAVMMFLIPLPTFILDALMIVNLVLSIMILLIVLYTRRALDFSIFPTILLISTVFGLALNVSSTRLILTKGAEFDGKMVRAFASFVVGSEDVTGIVVGFIIFIIIVAVQFIVITKGATRIAEVAARFTLDSLPGKQMAIEAEYNSGSLTEEQATRKKNDLQREVDFYGAMDGASKFVSGNVKVGILITVINVIGGLIVGMTIHGEALDLALNNYISLSIGDGLISQFPALLVSTATGLIVTRAISDGTFGSDVEDQFSRQSKVYWIASVLLLILSILPGFPTLILILMSIAIGFIGYRLSRKEVRAREEEAVRAGQPARQSTEQSQEMSPVVPLDPLSLELGYGLIPLVDTDSGAELLERMTRIRRESALELGLVAPRIRIIDNMALEPSEYCIKIKGVEVGRGLIRTGCYLAINPGHVDNEVDGEETRDPTFGLPAIWITEDNREKAERYGYTVVDAPSIIATHLQEIINTHAAEILGRQEVQSILDTLREDYPAVVNEVSQNLSTGGVQKVLQGLLRERVSIRNMVVILETLGDFAPVSKDTGFLVEKARQALGRQICLQYADNTHILRVMTLNPSLEQAIIDSRLETAGGVIAALEPDMQRMWINAVANMVHSAQQEGLFPLILCSESARPLIKNSTLRDLPDLVVLSVPEIAQDMKIEGIGEIKIDDKVA